MAVTINVALIVSNMLLLIVQNGIPQIHWMDTGNGSWLQQAPVGWYIIFDVTNFC